MTRSICVSLVLSLAMLSCILPSIPQASAPISPSDSIETVIVQTADAASTQTAQWMPVTRTPTTTPLPSKTPTETPTPTATVIFSIPTIDKGDTSEPSGSSAAYACEILSHSPSNESKFDPQSKFDAKWVVKNIGTRAWTTNNVDHVFVTGNRFYIKSGYDLPMNVDVGDSVELIVPMEAPKGSGNYATVWSLRVGNTQFCKTQLSIVVK